MHAKYFICYAQNKYARKQIPAKKNLLTQNS